jgi:DNA-directed RNA polymerase subunit alpha
MVLASEPLDAAAVQRLTSAISDNYALYRPMREAVQELEGRGDKSSSGKLRLGVCQYLIGRYSAAESTLSGADGGMAKFYLAKALAAQGKYSAAVDAFQAAGKAGYSTEWSALGKAEAIRSNGDAKGALNVLDSLSGAIEQTAEYLYQRGATVAALGGNPQEVIALYERAVDVDRNHAGALFGLAVEHDRHGNDEEALELYKRSVSQFPSYVGSWLNLGVLYEDLNQFERAQQCYQRILEAFPDHPRARLFLKDAQASGSMYYDEDAQKRRDRLGQVLSVPVTDFELSVRSRNCLQKMGIMTLGDLTRTTEQELLSSKNFGETSLYEIKDMMTSKGLELGQFAHERREPFFGFEPETMSADEQALLNKPIADLNLSVRARKCMIRLGISTVSDLVRRTGDELLECKNFGVTSLNEVREKLTAFGLKLRGD